MEKCGEQADADLLAAKKRIAHLETMATQMIGKLEDGCPPVESPDCSTMGACKQCWIDYHALVFGPGTRPVVAPK
jgi:hypothetical protein